MIGGNWFLYEHKRILYAVWERVLEPMTECTITPIDLAGQRVKLDEEVGEFLIGPHAETVEVCFCGSFRIWVSEHITQFLDKTCPIMQPVRQHKIGVLFIFELHIEVASLKRDDAPLWHEAANSEYTSLLDHGVWDLVKCPPNRMPIGSGWVFQIKYNADGSVEWYKARLVAKGY